MWELEGSELGGLLKLTWMRLYIEARETIKEFEWKQEWDESEFAEDMIEAQEAECFWEEDRVFPWDRRESGQILISCCNFFI